MPDAEQSFLVSPKWTINGYDPYYETFECEYAPYYFIWAAPERKRGREGVCNGFKIHAMYNLYNRCNLDLEPLACVKNDSVVFPSLRRSVKSKMPPLPPR
jgi:hypothetical protein